MKKYFTKYPESNFWAKDDENALEYTTARVVYRQSEDASNVFIREEKESEITFLVTREDLQEMMTNLLCGLPVVRYRLPSNSDIDRINEVIQFFEASKK